MDRTTNDFIYYLKRDKTSINLKESLAQFMSELTWTPIQEYNIHTLDKIARQMFADYISTADNPQAVVFELFEHESESWHDDLTDAILATLLLQRVKNGSGKFINGFYPYKKKEENKERNDAE